MGKKRSRDQDGLSGGKVTGKVADKDQDGSDGEDFEMVDVDFEWFNYDAEIDFHGVKSLLRQLLDVDASLFDVSKLADLVLSQPTIGSTVKVDGKNTDAFAMMTVLSADAPALRDVTAYLAQKAGTNPALAPVAAALPPAGDANTDSSSSKQKIGIVFSERLINMPAETAPPMYEMLVDEVAAAVEDGEPYDFSHYLVVSRTYAEVESTLEVEDGEGGDGRRRKRARELAEAPSVFYFHPEDEVLHRHAAAFGGFAYTKEGDAVADSKRAFQEMGIKTQGHMILIEASKFPAAVKAVNDYVNPKQ